jgi:hypothetical protein
MLKKKEFTILISILVFLSLASISLARVRCDDCYIQDCSCSISECSSGTLNIYSVSGCSDAPDFSFTFSDGVLPWQPSSADKYYLMAICDDAETKSSCTSIQVKSGASTETTTVAKDPCPTTYDCCMNEASYADKPCGVDKFCKDHKCVSTTEGGGMDSTTLLLVFLLVVLIVAAAAYFLIIKKKKQPKGGYEELYAKWRR